MLEAALYQTVYLLIVAFLTIMLTRQYATFDFVDVDKGYARHIKTVWCLTAFMIFFIGFRPINWVFVDMGNYYDNYMLFFKGRPFVFSWDTENFIFDNLFSFWGSAEIPIDMFFLTIAIVYFACITFACKKMFPDDAFLAVLVYLGAFSTFSYGTNGIKAGAAASLFLLALAYWENWWKCVLFLFLSIGFHHSMAAPVVAFIIAYFVKQRRLFYFIWIFAFIMAAMHITFFQSLFAIMTDEHGAGYLEVTDKARMVTGFRPDFILYSFIPIYLGDYILRRYEIESKEYVFIWNVYTLSNAVFMLCTYGESINRIAYLSWLMYPFVLLYPFLHFDLGERQYQYLQYVVYGHLGFTVFMNAIYYA